MLPRSSNSVAQGWVGAETWLHVARREPSLHPQALIWPYSLPNPYAPRSLELGREGGFRVHFFKSFRAGWRPSENELRVRLLAWLFSGLRWGTNTLQEKGLEPKRLC